MLITEQKYLIENRENNLINSYYFQWVHPRTGKRKEVSGSLPFGWERRHLPDGKVLYVNHDEQKTTYIDPRLAFAKECNSNRGLEDFRQRFDASSNALQVSVMAVVEFFCGRR